ncbi:helix-turn-helix domain-containing protein [Sphingobium yanoikuyae]|uniref:helix-turn-helix domain-containing protein n=1 Tax=Sphingobium yanoikuyae TaxID=13690 RepID=UPI0008471992|nr:helix-turn-helix domain-containing protein [Sphingobium yanoikuyae]
MSGGRRARKVDLSDEQVRFLEAEIGREGLPPFLADRYRAILLCAKGLPSKDVADQLGMHEQTVGKWRRRYARGGVEALTDGQRSGRPRSITPSKANHLVRRTIATHPQGASHWTIRSMAKETGMSQSSIRRIWAAFGLRPHQGVSAGGDRAPALADVSLRAAGLYMSPGRRALILEAGAGASGQDVISALGRPGMGKGCLADLLERVEEAIMVSGADRKLRPRAASFPAFLDRVNIGVAPQSEVHLLLDNYATSHDRVVRSWLLMHPKWKVHFSPDAPSWLAQAQLFLANIGAEPGGEEGGVPNSLAALAELYVSQAKNRSRSFSWVR